MKPSSTWGRIFPVLLFLCIATGAQAQRVDTYTMTTFAGTVVPIATSGGNALGYGDDGAYGFAAPFAFQYDGNAIAAGTTLYIMDNGMVGIGTASNAGYGTPSLAKSTYPNILCIMNSDLYHYSAGNYWLVSGVAPNRVLTMEEYNVSGYGYSTEQTTIQTKIYETTNVIEFWYSNYNYTSNGSDGCGCIAIGINGSTVPTFKSLTYNASTTTTPSANIRFTPPPPPSEVSVRPKSLAFGSVNSGASATDCTVTIYNPQSNSNLTINSYSITGNADFSLVGTLPTTIGPLQSAPVCLRFAPLASGNRSGVFTLNTNGRDSGTQSVTLTGTGIAPNITVTTTSLFKKTRTKLGQSLSQSFLVSSSGTGPLTFFSILPTGQYANQYAVTRMPANPLAQGATDTVTVTYTPTIEGSRPSVLVISSNALNIPSDSITLFGVGTLPRLVVTPTQLNFDSVSIGQQVCQNVTLKNNGSDTVYLTHNYFSSSDADFTMTPITGTDTIVPPDQSRTIGICFMPIRNGSRQARLRITTTIPRTFEIPSRDTSAFNVNIIGEGVPFGRLAIGHSAIIDSQVVGKQICRTDTFYNTGSANVTLTGASIGGADSSEYTFSGVAFPIDIAPGQSQIFNLCATPSQRGDRTATLNLRGTTSGKALFDTLPLDVFGQLACASATPSSAFTNKTCVGTTDTAFVTVSNCGDISTAYTATLPGTATTYTIAGATTSAVIGPKGTTTFPITFKPTDRSSQSTTLTITGSNGVTQNVTLAGTGQAATVAGSGIADSTMVNQSKTINLTINNTGECDWTPGTPTFSDPQFSYVSGGANIPAGQSGTMVVKFTPTKVGLQTATLSFPSAIGTSLPAANVTVSGIGTAIQGVERLTAANGYSLGQNYPNPFNPTTEIRFVVAKDGYVMLSIIDVTGKVVRTVFNERMTAGQHSTVVNALDLSSGVYYYQLVAGNTVLTRQMILAK